MRRRDVDFGISRILLSMLVEFAPGIASRGTTRPEEIRHRVSAMRRNREVAKRVGHKQTTALADGKQLSLRWWPMRANPSAFLSLEKPRPTHAFQKKHYQRGKIVRAHNNTTKKRLTPDHSAPPSLAGEYHSHDSVQMPPVYGIMRSSCFGTNERDF